MSLDKPRIPLLFAVMALKKYCLLTEAVADWRKSDGRCQGET